AMGLRIRPNLPLLGPLLGKDLGRVRAALEGGQFERLPDGRFRAAGLELEPNQVLVERIADEGWALASEESLVIALETKLDDELLLEGRVLDLIHKLNRMRKDAGLALTDRIRVAVPVGDVELLAHADQIKDEVLAVSVETRDQLEEPWIAKA